MSMAARAEIGTHDMSGARIRNATSDNTPSKNPDNLVVAPLEILTRVAPIVPAPGTPPPKAQPMLASSCPMSSLLESCLLLVMASSTTQVLRVSMESRAASVRAGTIRRARLDSSKCFIPSIFCVTASKNLLPL